MIAIVTVALSFQHVEGMHTCMSVCQEGKAPHECVWVCGCAALWIIIVHIRLDRKKGES